MLDFLYLFKTNCNHRQQIHRLDKFHPRKQDGDTGISGGPPLGSAESNVTMQKAMTLRAARLLATLGVLTLTACSSKPLLVAKPQATIANNTGKSLAAVHYKSCGSANSWAPLPQSGIPAGGTRSYTLPDVCVDLTAFYGDGKVAGTQRDIKREFPFNWVLY